ncbi:MAG: hypothetical protein AAGA90_07640 [Actinomycetota bacterium]
MAWLRRTFDHLFTEPREARPPGSRFSPEAMERHQEIDRQRKELEIEIEARRGLVGF